MGVAARVRSRERGDPAHSAVPISASAAQDATAVGHDPKALASGTLAPAAAIAPSPSPAVYRPVTSVARAAKRALTTAGSSVWASAMPAPATACSQAASPPARAAVATAMTASPAKTPRCSPQRRPTAAAAGAHGPIASVGMVVSNATPTADRPASARMVSTRRHRDLSS